MFGVTVPSKDVESKMVFEGVAAYFFLETIFKVKNRGRTSGSVNRTIFSANLISRCPACPTLLHPHCGRAQVKPHK